MAIIEQGILGGFRGSVGTVVGYWRLGRWCIRARSVAFKDARTAAQLTQRSRFKAMITLSSHLGPALQRGLTAAGNRHGMTEANLFMRLNNSCFEAEDGGVRVAYGRLRLSEGRLPGVRFTEVRRDGGRVEVLFDKQRQLQGARNEDVVHIYAYVPALGECRLLASTERRSRRVAFLLPDEYAGREVHLYGFVESSQTARYGTLTVAQKRHNKRLRNLEREVSDSAYIGCLGEEPAAEAASALVEESTPASEGIALITNALQRLGRGGSAAAPKHDSPPESGFA